jgi:hypothetical protein
MGGTAAIHGVCGGPMDGAFVGWSGPVMHLAVRASAVAHVYRRDGRGDYQYEGAVGARRLKGTENVVPARVCEWSHGYFLDWDYA